MKSNTHKPLRQSQKEKGHQPFFTLANDSKKHAEVPFFQPQLKTGKKGDKYEKEADAAASKAVNQATQGSQPAIQKQDITPVQASAMKEEEKPVQKASAEEEKNSVQKAGKEEEKPVQKKEEDKDKPVQKVSAEDEKPVQKVSAEEEKNSVQKAGKEEEKPVQKKEEDKDKTVQKMSMEEEKPVQKASAEEEKNPVQKAGKEEEKSVQKKEEDKDKPAQKMGTEEEKPVQKAAMEEKIENLQPKREEEREDAHPPVMHQKKDGTGSKTADLASRIEKSRGKGAKMSEKVAMQMEKTFGADLSNVIIHTDEESAQLNREMNSRAFTTGNDIYFGLNEYNPDSSSGKALLAHELTHVIQQTGNK